MMRNAVGVFRSRRGRRLVPAVAVVVGALALTGCNLGTHPGTNLGPIGFGAVVVDDAHHDVFVSGPTGNVVDVVDYAGNVVRTINHVYGASGMVIDGSNLYVAESTAGAIVKLNLADLNALPVTVGSGIFQPRTLALTTDPSTGKKKLWTAPQGSTWETLTSVDLGTGVVTNFPTSSYYEPDLASSPGAPNTLFVAEDGLSPGSVTRLDVSGSAPVVKVRNGFTHQSNIEGLVVSPDGKRVIPASGAPYDFEELDATTLQPDGIIYPGQPYPAAVAVSPGKGGKLATGLTGYVSHDLEIDPLGVPEALHIASTTPISSGYATIRPHGVALSTAGDLLVAVSGDDVYGTNTVVTTWPVP